MVGISAKMVLTLTMQPECWGRMMASASCMHRIAPKRLVSKRSWACCIDTISTVPTTSTPALFTSTSRRPTRSCTSWKAARTESAERTSIPSGTTRGGSSSPASRRNSAARSSAPRAAANTRKPSLASNRAVALPRPADAPVTNAPRPAAAARSAAAGSSRALVRRCASASSSSGPTSAKRSVRAAGSPTSASKFSRGRVNNAKFEG
mmetsp:Transcript_86183/g.267774  ORF Transcript_86183/g.267774 Transcript_86183/m.267774 type:complete len:207 (-) Transcript_86183:355-975(-)